MCPILPKLINNNNNSNTGIVPKPILQKLFPKHNTDMLIGFLRSLQVLSCFRSKYIANVQNQYIIFNIFFAIR